MNKPTRFVCIECGAGFTRRGGLRAHWLRFGHGPKQQQEDAVDRARWTLFGEDAPPPVRLFREDD